MTMVGMLDLARESLGAAAAEEQAEREREAGGKEASGRVAATH